MSTSMGNPSGSSPATNPVRQVGDADRRPASIGRPLDDCPGCGSWQLLPVVDIEAAGVHFLCGSCNRCWHVELGFVRRVNPGNCDGCPQPERCNAAYAQDHPPA